MSERINALEQLNTLGVSLVKRGANRKRLVTKAEGTMDADTIEVLKTIIEDVPAENEGRADEILKTSDEKARGAIAGIARLMSSFKDVLTPEALEKAYELAGVEVQKTAKETNLPGVGQKEAADGTMTKKKGKVTVSTPEKQEDATEASRGVSKSYDHLPEEVRAEMAKLWKSNEEAVAKAEAAETRAKAIESEALLKTYVAKAEKEFAHVPGQQANELGALLKSLHDQNPETASKVEALLKAAEAALGTSEMFRERGSSQSTGGSAQAQLDALAKGLVQKGEEGITYAEAYSQVMKDHPNLYSQYLLENPSQRG